MTTLIDPSISYVLEDNLAAYRELFLCCCKKVLEFPRGTILSLGGNDIQCMYFLLDGIVKVYTTNPSGYIRILGYHKRNTLFVMDGICSDEPAVVTTESVTSVKVLAVTRKELSEIGKAEPDFLNNLLLYYGTVLRLMCFDAEIKSIDDVSSRLASFLCLYTDHLSPEEGGAVRLTQDELASAVNASRVQIARICSDFKSRGLIDCRRGRIFVLDRDRLSSISKYG